MNRGWTCLRSSRHIAKGGRTAVGGEGRGQVRLLGVGPPVQRGHARLLQASRCARAGSRWPVSMALLMVSLGRKRQADYFQRVRLGRLNGHGREAGVGQVLRGRHVVHDEVVCGEQEAHPHELLDGVPGAVEIPRRCGQLVSARVSKKVGPACPSEGRGAHGWPAPASSLPWPHHGPHPRTLLPDFRVRGRLLLVVDLDNGRHQIGPRIGGQPVDGLPQLGGGCTARAARAAATRRRSQRTRSPRKP